MKAVWRGECLVLWRKAVLGRPLPCLAAGGSQCRHQRPSAGLLCLPPPPPARGLPAKQGSAWGPQQPGMRMGSHREQINEKHYWHYWCSEPHPTLIYLSQSLPTYRTTVQNPFEMAFLEKGFNLSLAPLQGQGK